MSTTTTTPPRAGVMSNNIQSFLVLRKDRTSLVVLPIPSPQYGTFYPQDSYVLLRRHSEVRPALKRYF